MKENSAAENMELLKKVLENNDKQAILKLTNNYKPLIIDIAWNYKDKTDLHLDKLIKVGEQAMGYFLTQLKSGEIKDFNKDFGRKASEAIKKDFRKEKRESSSTPNSDDEETSRKVETRTSDSSANIADVALATGAENNLLERLSGEEKRIYFLCSKGSNNFQEAQTKINKEFKKKYETDEIIALYNNMLIKKSCLTNSGELEESKKRLLKGKNILLIEDNSEFIRIITGILKSYEINLTVLECFNKAWAFLTDNSKLSSIDLVILDIKLPEKEGGYGNDKRQYGETLLLELKVKPKRIPVVVLSSLADMNKSVDGLDPFTMRTKYEQQYGAFRALGKEELDALASTIYDRLGIIQTKNPVPGQSGSTNINQDETVNLCISKGMILELVKSDEGNHAVLKNKPFDLHPNHFDALFLLIKKYSSNSSRNPVVSNTAFNNIIISRSKSSKKKPSKYYDNSRKTLISNLRKILKPLGFDIISKYGQSCYLEKK